MKMSFRPILVALFFSLMLVTNVYSQSFGSNGEYSATVQTTSKSFPAADYFQGQGPYFNNPIWVVSYEKADGSSALEVWKIPPGNDPLGQSDIDSPAITHPSPRSAAFFDAGSSTFQNVPFENMGIIGGFSQSSSTPSTSVTCPYIGNNAGGVVTGADPVLLPTSAPEGLIGPVAARDTTYPTSTVAGYPNCTVFIFGGETATGVTNTMYSKACGTDDAPAALPWSLVAPLDDIVPEARADHAAVSYRGNWYLFGGRNDSGVYGDMWKYTFSNSSWTNLTEFVYFDNTELNDNNASSILPATPPARYGHSMILVTGENLFGSNQVLILFGGTDGSKYFDDLWAFDFVTERWENIKLGANRPRARAFGGLLQSPTEAGVWVIGGHNATAIQRDVRFIRLGPAPAPGPVIKPVPNNIIAGVAAGILLVLIITVVVLKLTDRNNN